MKVYLVKRNDRAGYDEYDSAVVVAESPDQALNILKAAHINDYMPTWGDWNVTTEEVSLVSGIILESFNAGQQKG